jgi:hypothetical protein
VLRPAWGAGEARSGGVQRRDAGDFRGEIAFGLPEVMRHLHPQPDARAVAVHVSGLWRLTFAWDGDDAVRVDLEQYH